MVATIINLNKRLTESFNFSQIDGDVLKTIFDSIDAQTNTINRDVSYQYLKMALSEILQNIQEHSKFNEIDNNISFSTFHSRCRHREYVTFELQDNALPFLNQKNSLEISNRIRHTYHNQGGIGHGRGHGLSIAAWPIMFEGERFQISSGLFDISAKKINGEFLVSKNMKSDFLGNKFRWQKSLYPKFSLNGGLCAQI